MCAHAREGIFLKCKNIYTHFPLLFGGILHKSCCSFDKTLLCPIIIALSFFHYRIFDYCSPPLFPTLPLFCSHHSPTLHQHPTPYDYLCFVCTRRPFSRNSEISTLQNEYTIKKNLHFSSIFSLFRLISSHIHIGAYPFGTPSIIYFHGESQPIYHFPRQENQSFQ